MAGTFPARAALGIDDDFDGFWRAVGSEGLPDARQRESVGYESVYRHRARGEEPDGLGKLLLVDHGADDAELAPDDSEKIHCRDFVRQSGQDATPSRMAQLERLLYRHARAGGLDHEIDALAPRESARRVGGAAFPVGGEIVCAERPGEVPAVVCPPDREHAKPARLEDLDGEEPQRAHAEHGCRLTPSGLTARDGANDNGERLGQHQLIVAGLFWRRPATARRYAGLLGETSVDVDADRGSGEAQVAVAFAAERARATRVVWLDRDLLAGRERVHVGADRDHLADELVPHDERILHGAVAVPDAKIGAAETGGDDPNHRLGDSRCEERPLLQPAVPGPA